MSKFIIIVYVFVGAIFLFGCNADEHICENNIMENVITEEQLIENQISTNTNIQENEILTNISNEIAKETTKEETINKSENIIKETTTKPKNETVNTPAPTVKPVEQPVVKKEETKTDTVVPKKETKPVENKTPIESTPEPTPTPEETPKPVEPEVPKKNGYYYNEDQTNFLVSEFYRLTNNNPSFTVKPDEKARNSSPFWPYKESEITKQIINITFGDFIVYAEDYYKDDVKQRTLYYICFDV